MSSVREQSFVELSLPSYQSFPIVQSVNIGIMPCYASNTSLCRTRTMYGNQMLRLGKQTGGVFIIWHLCHPIPPFLSL